MIAVLPDLNHLQNSGLSCKLLVLLPVLLQVVVIWEIYE